jgi:hypothetical protein
MKHVIFDLFNCHESMLYWKSSNDFRDHIKKCVSEVALIVDESWGKFDNDAYTGTLLLSESHFSIHTWPENRSCNLDRAAKQKGVDDSLFVSRSSFYLAFFSSSSILSIFTETSLIIPMLRTMSTTK